MFEAATHKRKIGVNNRYSINDPLLKVFNIVIILLFTILVVGPFFIVVVVSLKTNQEYASTALLSLPKNIFNIENFRRVLTKQNYVMLIGFKNSLILIVISVFLSVITGTMAAYVFDRFQFRLKTLILGLFLLAVMIPKETTHVATFNIINSLGLFNTIWAPILLYIGTDIIQLIIFIQFISQIPISIDESARMDGASYFKVYWHMILPLMKPAITTVVIIKAVMIYNDMFIPYLYMTKKSLAVVSTALMKVGSQGGSARLTDWPLMSAAVIIAIIPTLILFFIFQRNIIAGLAQGSIK